MRVLRIFHGGVVPEYQARDEELAALGCEVRLLVPSIYTELPVPTRAVPRTDVIEVVPMPVFGRAVNPWFFYSPRVIRSHLLSMRPDIVDIHEEPYSLAMASVLVALRGLDVQMVFRTSQNEFKRYPPPFGQIQHKALSRASAAYAPSSAALGVLRRKGFESKPLAVIGNGVSVPLEEHFKSRANGPLRVVYAGRLIPRKGVRDLVAAAVGCGDGVKVSIVGTGPERAQIEEDISGRGVQGSVDLYDTMTISALHGFFLKQHVICTPSLALEGWSEQFSRSTAEGMAHFCVPCVADTGALPEVVGPVGEIFAAGDPDSIASHLLTLCDDPGLNGRRRDAHAFANEHYSWASTSRRLLALYAGHIT